VIEVKDINQPTNQRQLSAFRIAQNTPSLFSVETKFFFFSNWVVVVVALILPSRASKTNENYRKLTENYRNQLKIFQETINNDLQKLRLYKKCFSMVTNGDGWGLKFLSFPLPPPLRFPNSASGAAPGF